MSSSNAKQDLDKEIRGLWADNPRKAFQLMFAGYYEEACRHIYRYTVNTNTAEDIAQEMFTELWDKRESLEIKTSIGAYLHRMAVTRSLNYIRDNKKRLHETDQALVFEKSKMDRQDDLLAAQDLQKVIDITIETLPDRCRQVFMLSRFEDMTYQQIGETMEISVKTVENQMIKALRQLREAVAKFKQDNVGGKP